MVHSEVMPVEVAVRFAHAVAQTVADRHGIRVLHIKGPAVDEALLDLTPADPSSIQQPIPRLSTDADVWADPHRVNEFIAAMGEHGWSLRVAFEDDSAFEHSATLVHDRLGYMDVHREFPGIGLDSQSAFDLLWGERSHVEIAGHRCWVPAVTAQRLILLLQAARDGRLPRHPDIRRTWTDATDTDRADVRALAGALRAEVPLAAATGELSRFRGRREYWLWNLLSQPGARHSMVAIWAARVWAEPDPVSAARSAFRLLMPKPQRLTLVVGRPPTKREIANAYWQRVRFGCRELARLVRG